jgi:hypothetical protein
MARIPVYFPVKDSLPSKSPHKTSATFASLLLRVSWARAVKAGDLQAGIVLISHMTWSAVKEHFKGTTVTVQHKILPPRKPETLMLSYPPKSYESDARQKQKELWLSDAMIPARDRVKETANAS